jgi:hypothetical protein
MHAALRERVRARLKKNPHRPARGSRTASRSRLPGWEEKSAATTGPRRSKAESAICSWTRRAWCSKRGSTAQKSKTATASSSCSRSPHGSVSRSASPTCGWTQATPAKTKRRRMGGEDTGLDGRDRAAPAQAGSRGGGDEVGEGVSQRGRGARPEEPTAPEGTQTVLAEEVGGGEDVFVHRPEREEDEQRLREAMCE